MFKKLFFILTIFCIFTFNNTSKTYYYNNGYYNYGYYNNIPNNFENLDISSAMKPIKIATYALSALIAYSSHKLLCYNIFYREKFTPLAKKVCFFIAGTEVIKKALIHTNDSDIKFFGTIISGFIAYKLNNMLNKNDVYREEINPFAKKVFLLSAGANITYIAFALWLKL